ncbi:nitrate reductase [Xanthobacter versatilis]|uniref:nitrate reductase n=1 Tax=Xanthobacter autotrophicus (strain ATCC BAA-1158 / Py2) TaxID=78245 RepID=UPI003727A1D6
MATGAAHDVKTTCPYCGVGCGVIATVTPDGSVSVSGDPEHPANFGRLCSKGSALAETIDLDGRLLRPHIDGRPADWDEALDLVAARFASTIAEYGPDSVAFYVSGQLLTEDYYVANKLMKGFIGSANIDTNSRLCMASSVAGHRRAFGTDTVPGNYEDLELADLIVLVGSNLAWCHPVLYQRIAAEKERRPSLKIVVIDPRRTMTADIADMHLAISPDGDVALFGGLLSWIANTGALNYSYISNFTTGAAQALRFGAQDLRAVSRKCGIAPSQLIEFYSLFTRTERTVTVYSQGVNQSETGTDKVNAIINCHLATGRIGKPGASPFSVTGQPNAMGGREVGGMANMLAAHMDIENETHRARVQRFWQAPTVATRPGRKAVEMFEAIGQGHIKAVWIAGTNPVDSMPEADRVRAALAACPFVVVSDVLADTDTTRVAHVLLPAAAWGEKDGTVTNSERRISRQRPFLPLPGSARPDWDIMADVARRMGFVEGFSYTTAAEVFAEHAALSAFENDGERDFDIGAHAGIDAVGYEALAPFQWPQRRGEVTGTERFFAAGGFFTPEGKGRFVAPRETRAGAAPLARLPAQEPTDQGFILNTGRVRDHWHTMTRTGKSPRLSQHMAEPFVEIHPDDAAQSGIAEASLVRLSKGPAQAIARALITNRQRRGSVFVPMHWNDQFASNARIDALVDAVTDPVSGQPALKQARASLASFNAAAYGFAVVARKPADIPADYWAMARCTGGWRLELAFGQVKDDWHAFALRLFGGGENVDILAYNDVGAGRYRIAAFDGAALLGALFIAPQPVGVARGWLVEQLATSHDLQRQRLAVLATRPSAGQSDKGAIVCSCFGVGSNEIAAAIASGCRTVKAVGDATQAGTNCGSCRAEIKGIIDAKHLQAAE